MAIIIDWDLFYPSTATPTLTEKEAQSLVDLMLSTGKGHVRDFPPGMNKKVAAKTTLGDWMRIRVGRDQDTDQVLVVIIYHRLQHFQRKNRWGISVGVHDYVTSSAPLGTTTPLDPDYVDLAQAIGSQMHVDALNNLPPLPPDHPGSAKLVIYDDIHPPLAHTGGIAPDAERVKTRIGYLGWVAQNTMDRTKWDVDGPKKRPRPRERGAGGKPIIKGWGRDKGPHVPIADTHVIRTILTPK